MKLGTARCSRASVKRGLEIVAQVSQPAVSPTSSRQAAQAWRGLRIGNPRYSRQEVCATVASLPFALLLCLQCATGFAAGLEWNTSDQNHLPQGWQCGGTGTGIVVAAFAGAQHPVVKLDSTGDGLVLWNYHLAASYAEHTLARYKFQFGSQCVGAFGFANDGGGGRGGCGVYFTAAGTLEVADERGARTTLLTNCATGIWYELRAFLSTTDDKWDVEVTEVGTGRAASLKALPWSQPAVWKEKAYAGLGVSVWSPGTLYIAAAEIGPAPPEVKAKKQSALPILGIPLAANAPILDGKLSPDEWTAAAHIGALFTLNTGTLDPKPCDVFLRYDASNLHLAFRQPLRSAREVQPSYTKRDDNLWMDDCFEFLLSPTRDEKDRVHFIGNAAGAIYDDKGGDKTWNGHWTYRTTVTDTGWEGELAIPLADLGPPPRDGDAWAFNVGRSLLSHDAMLSTTYAVWARPARAVLGFMDLATYGILQFRGRQPWVALDRMASAAGNQFTARFIAHNPTDQPAAFAFRVDDNSAILAPLAEKQISVPPRAAQSVELTTEFPNRWRATVALNSAPILRQETLNPFANQPALAVRPYPLQNFLEVELDLSHLRRATGNAFQAKLQVLPAGPAVALGDVTNAVTKRIPIRDLPVGDYTARVTVTDAAGKLVTEIEKPFVRAESQPKWFTNPVGTEDRLLQPFTPVVVKGGQIKVWGRAHDFGQGGLPAQITAAGTPLLAGPIQLHLNGQPLEFRRTKWLTKKRTRAAWESRAGTQARLVTTIEFDGLIRCDLTLPAGLTIESLDLVAPLRSVTHYYTSVLDQYSSEAGRLPADGFHTAFRPLVWAGDMDRGLVWCAETDRDLRPADWGRVIEITRSNLCVHWIGRPVTLARARTYTFALQATPVKPLPVGHESWRVGRDFVFPWCQQFTDALTNPMVQRPDFHQHVQAEHARGCAVLPYFFPTSMKADARDCRAYKNEWGHPADLPDIVAEQYLAPDMKMRINTSWTDYFMAALDEFVRDYDVDGVYYDTTGPMRQSLTDEHGARYTYWPLFACREFHRRTANIFERRKGAGRYILMNHMSDNVCVPSLSFFTLLFDGEQYNRVPLDATDYTQFLPLARAEVINNPMQWGLPVMFLPEIPVRHDPAIRRANRLATDSLLAMLLPLANSWWDGPMDYLRQKEIADALLQFDVARATFHPYWRQQEFPAPAGVLISYYAKAGQRLVIVSNPGPQPRTISLPAGRACRDVVDGTTVNTARVEIAARSFRLLRME